MTDVAPVVDPDALVRARALLERPERKERMWPVLAAAAVLALTALALAAAMVMAPPVTVEHVAHTVS